MKKYARKGIGVSIRSKNSWIWDNRIVKQDDGKWLEVHGVLEIKILQMVLLLVLLRYD